MQSLTRHLSKSCGCYNAEQAALRIKHGESSGGKLTPEFSVYRGMLNRCRNTRDRNYPAYGGRGITVCARWLESVENFIADMGRRPSENHTLERKDNDKGYSPENCKWATMREQANNRRSSTILTFNGKSKTIAEWSRYTGMSEDVLSARHCRGWSTEHIFTQPIRRRSAK